MTAPAFMTRRVLLRHLARVAGAVTLALPVLSAEARAVPGRTAGLSALKGLIRHEGSAALVGSAYLARFAGEASADVLVGAILSHLPPQEIDAQWMRHRVQRDFETGDVVDLDGWQLSRTEARLCALYAL